MEQAEARTNQGNASEPLEVNYQPPRPWNLNARLKVELPCFGAEVPHNLFSTTQAKEEKAKSQ